MTWVERLEHRRLDRHFRRVGTRLAADDRSSTDPRRRDMLDELDRYRERGRFPRNAGLVFRPSLIDDHGTRCAVGHLLEHTGAAPVLREWSARDNHVLIRDLDDERFDRWLDEVGLSRADAARIQVPYGTGAFSSEPSVMAQTTAVVLWLVTVSIGVLVGWLGRHRDTGDPPTPRRQWVATGIAAVLAGAVGLVGFRVNGPEFIGSTFEQLSIPSLMRVAFVGALVAFLVLRRGTRDRLNWVPVTAVLLLVVALPVWTTVFTEEVGFNSIM